MTSFLCVLFYAGLAVISLYFARPFLRWFKKFFLAKMVINSIDTCNKAMRDRKQQLFDDGLLSLGNKQKNLEVLEIGAGAGANFNFYPPGTNITCLEPNEFFEETLRKNALKLEGTVTLRKFILGRAEEMSEVADSSMDACVCTYVLCSVDDPQLVIKQILRVLKPGGRFLFLEHVAADDRTWTQFFQKLFYFPWHNTFDCDITQRPKLLIENAGFAETKTESFFAYEFAKMETGLFFTVVFKLVAPHSSGYAIK